MDDQQQLQTPPPNYLVWAIITTIMCCLPFGIVSIVFAAQVNTKWAAGDITGAQNSSKNAKTWAWVSFGTGLFVIIAYAVLVFTIGLAAIGLDSFEGLDSFDV